MNYEETIDYLYSCHPAFERMGAGAYKPGLETSVKLDNAFGNPHRKYPTIHIAGTNGKGSTAHTLAAVFQSAGYKTGLYTSPHLFDFRERIRVDGKKIDKDYVVSFIERYMSLRLDLHPSFFELTMTMAFEWFAHMKVEVAIIETGLGGRLDSTNIIRPELSIITNISKDHTAFLGDTLTAIAGEKAGIIKPGIPVVVGEADGEVRQVFIDKATEQNSRIAFAEPIDAVSHENFIIYPHTIFGELRGELTGDYQVKNTATILAALRILSSKYSKITDKAVANGFSNVVELTGLMGRWTKISDNPTIIIDTGHNEGGWRYIARQMQTRPGKRHIIAGFVNDKDVDSILKLISGIDNTSLYLTQPQVERALPVEELSAKAASLGLNASSYKNLADALVSAKSAAGNSDTILIAGSNYLISELKDYFQ